MAARRAALLDMGLTSSDEVAQTLSTSATNTARPFVSGRTLAARRASMGTYLLTSQLEGQRRYFEEQVERAVDKASQASARADEAAALAQQTATAANLHSQSLSDQSSALARAEKNLEKSERSREKFEKLAREMSAALREEKIMNEGLMKRIAAADAKAAEARRVAEEAGRAKAELQEMVDDLTAFVSGQEKVRGLQAAGEEVMEGGSGVVQGPKKKGKGRKK